MNKYEAMFIVRPDLSEDERKAVLNQINDAVIKNSGNVLSSDIWLEKRKLCFKIKKYHEGAYYLVSFNIAGEAIKDIRHIYRLNESILRVLVSRVS